MALAIQEAATFELDDFAVDRDDTLEVPTTLSMLSTHAGLQAGADQVAAREHRLTEYLQFGAGGNAFSDNPATAVAGEDRGWSNSNMRGVFADLFHRKRLLDYLWWLYSVGDPVARNIVNAYTFFVVGDGPTVTFKSGNDADDKARAEKWKVLSRKIKWSRRVRQVVLGVSLFGEAFVLTLPRKRAPLKVENGKVTGTSVERSVAGVGEPALRVLNAGDIEEIIFKRGDPDDVIAYAQRRVDGTLMGNAPEDIVHVTFDTLPNSLRGQPLLLPVLQQLYQYRQWLGNRHWLNMIRSRVPLIIKSKAGGPNRIRAAAAKYGKLPPPGTVWVLPGTLDADFPNLNVNAADARDDAKQLLRTIAMGVSMPEVLVAADASGGNYSSSIVAESPAMRMFSARQDVIEPDFAEVVARLMGVPPEHVEVTFPRTERNIEGRVKAMHLGYTAGVLSARTFSEDGFARPWEGPDGERARLEAEGVVFDADGRPAPVPGDPPGSTPEPGQGRGTPPGDGAEPGAGAGSGP